MKMNMLNFKKALKWSSINYLIPNISMKFKDGKIICYSISSDSYAISFIEIPDNVIGNKKEELEFNFSDMQTNLVPYLSLINDEKVDIKITDQSLKIKDSENVLFKLFFCSKDFTNNFDGTDAAKELDFFHNEKLNKNLLEKLNEIKKIGLQFEKLYFICEEDKLFIECTDKQNPFSNSIKLEISKLKKPIGEMSMCFDFKSLSYIISTIENDFENFNLKCTYLPDNEAGMILFEHSENFIKYYLTSKP